MLVIDDGKNISNRALNYAVSLSDYNGAELFVIRILQDMEKYGDISFEGSQEISQIDIHQQDFHRKTKGGCNRCYGRKNKEMSRSWM